MEEEKKKKPIYKKVWFWIIIVIIIIAVGGDTENNNTAVTTNEGKDNSTILSENGSLTVNTQTQKVYGLNEELTIKKSSREYILVVTGITEMSERNEFSDKEYQQVFLIDYTYKNISNNDTVYISNSNFKIIDEEGEIGGTYPNSTSKHPENITEGVTCKAQMVLGVNNKSNTIKLQYFDNMFNSKPDATFELNVTQ